jgi:hypothetical protein
MFGNREKVRGYGKLQLNSKNGQACNILFKSFGAAYWDKLRRQ